MSAGLPMHSSIGPYRVIDHVGAGGMGQVYRARHVILRHDVALKLLSPELTRDPVMRERFVREAAERIAGFLTELAAADPSALYE